MNDIEQRLSELMARKAAAADVRPEPDFLRTRAAVRHAGARAARWTTPRLVAIAAAAVVLVVGVVLTVTVGRDAPDAVDGGPGGGITVYHQRVEMTLDAQLECDEPIDTTGTFLTAIVDTYSDRVGRQWRSIATYPDGSTREWIHLGSAIYPTESAERGTAEAGRVGCVLPNGERVEMWGLPSDGFYTLDTLRELAPDEIPYVLPMERRGTRIDGRTDSMGRPAVLWQRVNEGTAEFSGSGELSLHQVDEWYVDAADLNHIVEHRLTDATSGMGRFAYTEVLVADGQITVDADFFDTEGYTLHGPLQRPDLTGGDGSTDTTASATEFLLTDALRELGVDLATAPAEAITIGDAEFCGWESVTYGDTSRNTEAQQCLLAAHTAGRAAVYVVAETTIEGDPVVSVYRTESGAATLYADATRDRFGSGRWETVACQSLAIVTHQEGATEVPAVQCTNNG